VSYRDDVDALYNRATSLQSEIDQMREQLAERDRRIAELAGGAFQREDTSPGLRAIRELPPAEEIMSRLVDTWNTETGYQTWKAQAPTPTVIALPDLAAPTTFRRSAVLERARDLLGALADDRLVQIGAVIEAIVGDEASEDVLDQLRVLVALVAR
jgi:hypothetical protein